MQVTALPFFSIPYFEVYEYLVLRIVSALLLQLPPFRNSDPGSHRGHSHPLPATVSNNISSTTFQSNPAHRHRLRAQRSGLAEKLRATCQGRDGNVNTNPPVHVLCHEIRRCCTTMIAEESLACLSGVVESQQWSQTWQLAPEHADRRTQRDICTQGQPTRTDVHTRHAGAHGRTQDTHRYPGAQTRTGTERHTDVYRRTHRGACRSTHKTRKERHVRDTDKPDFASTLEG